MRNWQLQEAKARFSQLVRLAREEGPQQVSVHGEPTVVVLAKTDFEQLKNPQQTLVKFLRSSPLMGIKLDIKRNVSLDREIDL
ncbi:MAG: type II toxin-antitoxin system Phd/YefM family antitoxin [Gammaproteobacteria bacterium]|nr:type II toxin-antitoxin system Phd/YefM family antitoxin [Gammaproteobacteria bacterium]